MNVALQGAHTPGDSVGVPVNHGEEAWILGSPEWRAWDRQSKRFHGDEFQTTLAITDDADLVAMYDPYGMPFVSFGEDTGYSYLFQGRNFDYETGNYYFRTRYYDPEFGRFLSLDTIGTWGDENNFGNPYAFLGNHPFSGVDPFGEKKRECKWYQAACHSHNLYNAHETIFFAMPLFGDIYTLGELAIAGKESVLNYGKFCGPDRKAKTIGGDKARKYSVSEACLDHDKCIGPGDDAWATITNPTDKDKKCHRAFLRDLYWADCNSMECRIFKGRAYVYYLRVVALQYVVPSEKR